VRLNLRWRLTVWNVLGLAVVLAGFAALVYGLLARAHYQRINRSLLAEFQELAENHHLSDEARPRLRHWIAEAKEHENFFCIVYGPDGKVHERTRELPADSIPPVPQVPAGEPRLHDQDVPAVGRQRVLAGRLRLGGRGFPVILMAPLEEVDRELGQLLTALLVAVPVALAAAGGWGYLMARKALAPLERLRRSTEEITAARLDRRLPVADAADELGRLTQTINAMIARLERSFAEIRRFTADASHELRTPLTVIRTESEVALARPLNPEDCRNLIESVLEECERLTHLTEQLLAMAREDAGAGGRALEPVDLSALVHDVVEDMRPLAEARGLLLHSEPDGPLPLPGDGPRLRQVFINLLDNAIKYTPTGGTVRVQLARGDGAAVVTVRDTGIGISPEHLPRVFDRFYRVDKARSREQGGTGLGLSIARSIVASHGGSIKVDSAPGQGTTFTVTLPEKHDTST
jgi:heavy metal sensor kinase